MKYLVPAIRFKIFMILLLGLVYPFAMTSISQVFFHQKANGAMILRGGQNIGSKLIAQKFESNIYFWSRPSSIDYNPLASGGSNLGPTSKDLKKAVDERRSKLKAAHPDQNGEPPQDLIFASASGLDPHISVEGALYQAERVAIARGQKLVDIQNLIAKETEEREVGIFGETKVNVLALNLALDKIQGIDSAPQVQVKK